MTRIILIALTILGCDKIDDEYPKIYQHRDRWCSGKEDSKNLVDCMERITKAGNPMSDEEGEDLVSMLVTLIATGTVRALGTQS